MVGTVLEGPRKMESGGPKRKIAFPKRTVEPKMGGLF